MIDLVRDRFLGDAIDRPLNLELVLTPSVVVKGASQSLCSFGFATARSDDFLDRDGRVEKDGLQTIRNFWKVDAE